MIFETDIIIWALRQNENASTKILQSLPLTISAVTYMELMQGTVSKQDMLQLKKFLKSAYTTTLPITEPISYRAMNYVENYTLNNSMELADALIAATCMEYGETLCTGNLKHYKCIPNLPIELFQP